MRFRADEYISEQIWNEFGEKTVFRSREECIDGLSGEIIHRRIEEKGARYCNGFHFLFRYDYELRWMVSEVFEKWMKENYPEYLL